MRGGNCTGRSEGGLLQGEEGCEASLRCNSLAIHAIGSLFAPFPLGNVQPSFFVFALKVLLGSPGLQSQACLVDDSSSREITTSMTSLLRGKTARHACSERL